MRWILQEACGRLLGAAVLIDATRLFDPCCETPGDLREKMLAEVPGLEGTTPIEAAELLLSWAANTTVMAAGAKTLRGDTEPMPPHRVYTEVFAPDLGGVICGGASTYYRSILHLFGIDPFTVNFGILEGDLTHVSIVVPHEGPYYLFDPTFAATFRKGGKLVPIGQLLAGDLDGVEVHELSLAKRDFLSVAPTSPVCRTEPTKTEALYVCGIGETSFMDYSLAGWAGRLEKAGIRLGVETLPALMRRGFFSVGPAPDETVRNGFIRMLAEYGVPMHRRTRSRPPQAPTNEAIGGTRLRSHAP